jgi:hypothetical protein
MSSRLFAVVDAIVAALTAAGVKTWDGPVLTGDFDAAVFVGYDASPDGDFRAAALDQSWSQSVGSARRDETIEVICAAWALVGGDSTKGARDAVQALFTAVETTLRANPSLGFSPPCVAEVKPRELFCEPTDQGYQVWLTFSIYVRTRV